MKKTKLNLWNIVLYILAIAIILSGIFCGMNLYKDYFAESKSYGNGFNIDYEYSIEEFNYKNSSVTFSESATTNEYLFETDLLKVNDFNALVYNYELVLNNYTLTANFSAGAVESVFTINFYDTSNNLLCAAEMNIYISFLANRTYFKLTCDTELEQQYLSEYFTNNGIVLYINQIN